MAASSCQMLMFLHLAAKARIDVVAYEDDAGGLMPEDAEPVRITEIALRPRIVVAGEVNEERVRKLVDTAHQHCFIANSLNSEMTIEPTIEARLMSIPDVLERLLTTAGPPGHEAAPAAVWREAAEAFGAEVDGRCHGHVRCARGRPRRAPAARGRRPHRRDRPAGQPRERQGLPARGRLGRLGSAGAGRPASRGAHPQGPDHGRGRAQADSPPRIRGAQEGRRAQAAARGHRRA